MGIMSVSSSAMYLAVSSASFSVPTAASQAVAAAFTSWQALGAASKSLVLAVTKSNNAFSIIKILLKILLLCFACFTKLMPL